MAAACRSTSTLRKDSGRRADPDAAARGRKILEQELPVLRRPALASACRSSMRCRRRVSKSRSTPRRARSTAWTSGRRAGRTQTQGRRQRRRKTDRYDAALLADPKCFDTPKISLPKLKHVLRAKAVLCAGLTVRLTDDGNRRERRMALRGRPARLPARDARRHATYLPADLYMGSLKRDSGSGRCSRLAWCPTANWCRKATST